MRLTLSAAVAAVAILAAASTAQDKTYAHYEQFFDGTLLEGDYLATHADDGSYESIQEIKRGRSDRLGHLWGFTVPAGSWQAFSVRAFLTDSGEGDDIEFYWSVDDVTYTPLLVYRTEDGGTLQSAPLPASVSGQLLIWMQDADRTRGHQTLDTFSIDWMYVETGLGGPPLPPSNLLAAGNTSSSVVLGWSDDSADEDGFRIERSADGINWSVAGTVGADVTWFEDDGLLPATAYDYRVFAFNGQGDSAASNTAAATTRALDAFQVELVRVTEAGRAASHAVDPLGQFGVRYTVGRAPDPIYLEFATWNGSSWDIDIIEQLTDERAHPDVALSPAGVPSCAYFVAGGPQLRYAEKVGSSWVVETVDDEVLGYPSPSLVYDSLGLPAIAYLKNWKPKDRGLYLARRDGGGWQIERVVEDWCLSASLAFDLNGWPAIAYGISTDRQMTPDVLELVLWNGSAWESEFVESEMNDLGGFNGNGEFPTLGFDPSTGWPSILHGGTHGLGARFVSWNGTSWVTDVIWDPPDGLLGLSFAFDSQGTPYVSHLDYAGVWCAHRIQGSWQYDFVDGIEMVSGRSRLRVGPDDQPSIWCYGTIAGVTGYLLAHR